MLRHKSRSIFWDGTHGLASYGRACVLQLRSAPVVNGAPVGQLDYAPVVGLWLILETATALWRELTIAERIDLDARLELMASAGLAVWE